MAKKIVSIKSVRSGVSKWIVECTERVNLIDGYLNRVVKQDYINAQIERFQTENAGTDFDGGRWTSLDSKYSKYKRKRFEDYPGGGTKLLIGKSNLMQSLLLSDQYFPSPKPKKIRAGISGLRSRGENAAGSLAVVDAASIHIYTLVPYAKYVDEKRTFTSWSLLFWDRINTGILNYLAGRLNG
jgi:hypothetical protein